MATADSTTTPSGSGTREGEPPVLWTPQGQPYVLVDGKPSYLPPDAALFTSDPKLQAWGAAQGISLGANGEPVVGPNAPGGGGFFTDQTWNPETGQFDTSVDWGQIAALGAGGAVGAGALSGILGGTGALAGGLPEGVTEEGTVADLGLGTQAATDVGAGASVAPGGAVLDAVGGEAPLASTAISPTGALVSSAPLDATAVSPVGALATGTSPAESVFDESGNFIGDTTIGDSTAGSSGDLDTIGKYANVLSGVGSGISAATGAAANNRLAMNDPYVQRAKLEDTQRNQDLKNIYMANAAFNPKRSPFDPVAPTTPTGNYATALNDLSGQGLNELSQNPMYSARSLPSLQPGTLEQIGQWAGPILSTIGGIAKLL